MQRVAFRCLALFLVPLSIMVAEAPKPKTDKDFLELIIKETKPLKHPRGNRLPLYVWSARLTQTGDEAEIERLIRALDERGIAVLSVWNPGALQASLEQALKIGKIQKKLGLMVNVDATGAVYSFCDGSEDTGHLGGDGKKFFDMSFAGYVKMGCPFGLHGRCEPMKQKLEPFLKGYQAAGVPLDFWTADWEIDGPIEWNDAWKSSKQCVRCRANMPKIDNFTEFQKALRQIRSHIQNEVFCKTIKTYFPKALIGNYAMNPHNGYRYWYDYFEKDVPGMPGKKDQNALYRQWAHEFDSSGYTMAMPVVYTWYPIHDYYTFENRDYRWFYNLLLEVTSVGQTTAATVPVVPFVHWTTTNPPQTLPQGFGAMSETAYKELLWHSLLRGHDSFIMWCPNEELAQEVRPLQEVYAASLEYRDFLSKGEPVLFEVPKKPDTVVSAVKLENRLLVRRTDFGGAPETVKVKVGKKALAVPKVDGQCQIIELP